MSLFKGVWAIPIVAVALGFMSSEALAQSPVGGPRTYADSQDYYGRGGSAPGSVFGQKSFRNESGFYPGVTRRGDYYQPRTSWRPPVRGYVDPGHYDWHPFSIQLGRGGLQIMPGHYDYHAPGHDPHHH